MPAAADLMLMANDTANSRKRRPCGDVGPQPRV